MRHKFSGVAFALAAVAISLLPGTAGAGKSGVEARQSALRITAGRLVRAQLTQRAAIDPKLQYQLGALAKTSGKGVARQARALGVRLNGGSVRVIVQTRGRPDLRALAAAGARVEAHVGGLVQASVPVAALQRVTGLPGVRFVRLPSYQELDTIQGEEVAASNALASIQKGWTGKGVKVAIVDAGFGGYQDRIAEGELPSTVKTRSYCHGSGPNDFTENTQHGTAVAEIVHEMAPNAQLYLICYETEVDFVQAEQYAKSVGAQIISHSGSAFNDGRGDGAAVAGTEAAVVADARQSGILWVNSSGNSAERHWSGTFVDANGDGLLDFAPDNQGNGVVLDKMVFPEVDAFVKWDEWPAATDDFDLYLVTQTGQVVAKSATVQSGSQPPIEQLRYTYTGSSPAVFFLIIQAVHAASTPRLDLFVTNSSPPLQYAVAASSVGDPGASPFAFTAGAICWQNNALETYSGEGPTIDGRVKPDIAGQDSNSGATYGPFTACGKSGFTGTSASAPAVAGAAALVKEENPTFTADQIQAFMQQNAQDLGPAGPDNQFGYGKLFIPTPTAQGPTIADKTPPKAKALKSKGVRGKTIKLLSRASDETGEVRIVETVKKGSRTIATIKTGYAATKPGVTYYVLWKAPRSLVGTLQHCVDAYDHAENKSPHSCASLIVTKK